MIFSLVGSSQTITKADIYRSTNQRISISEFAGGAIIFYYQNPDYTHIVDLLHFGVINKTEALALMDECLHVLSMEKTGQYQHIYHNYKFHQIIRYGFNQNSVVIGRLHLNAKTIEEIKLALLNYSYSSIKNQ
jgi:hypothetical protein